MAFDGGVDFEILLSALINDAVTIRSAIAEDTRVELENIGALIITLIEKNDTCVPQSLLAFNHYPPPLQQHSKCVLRLFLSDLLAAKVASR